jgi:hypothetical protein
MYCDKNFKTKKSLREALARGEAVGVFQPGPFGSGSVRDGEHVVEGPHYPQPHTWYASVRIVGGLIVSAK